VASVYSLSVLRRRPRGQGTVRSSPSSPPTTVRGSPRSRFLRWRPA